MTSLRAPTLLLAALALAGCPSTGRGDPPARPTAEPPTAEAPTAEAPKAPPPRADPTPPPADTRSTPMTDFDKARAAYVAHIAEKTGAAPDAVAVVPKTEGLAARWRVPAGADTIDPRIGDAWAFEGGQAGDPPYKMQRGWATADGDVLTAKGPLGRLFVEAGAWSDSPKMSIDEVVSRLIWSFGPRHRPTRAPSVKVERAEDGSGAVHFQTDMSAPGGPPQAGTFVITLGADQTATLEAR